MTTPHTEQPAEGPDKSEDHPAEPSNPDKTGDSIDSSGVADDDSGAST